MCVRVCTLIIRHFLPCIAAKGRTCKVPDPDHYYEQAPPLPPVEHVYEHIQDYQKKNSVAIMADIKLDLLDSNWQSIHLVNSDLVHDSVVSTPPLLLPTVTSSKRNTIENQVGDYVEMRMIIDSQDGKCGNSFAVSCGDFPAICGNSNSISCGPLAAL